MSRIRARSSGVRAMIPTPRNTDPAAARKDGRLSSRTWAVARGGSSRVSRAASAAMVAVTHITATGSSAATRMPAPAGPASSETPPRDSRRPISREASMRDARAMAGSIASRAVIPGTSPKEFSTAIAMNQPRLSPTVGSMIGSSARASAEITSESTAAVRRLMRSTREPISSPANAAGTAAAIATSPASPALPVVSSTSSGRAMAVTELPSSEMP